LTAIDADAALETGLNCGLWLKARHAFEGPQITRGSVAAGAQKMVEDDATRVFSATVPVLAQFSSRHPGHYCRSQMHDRNLVAEVMVAIRDRGWALSSDCGIFRLGHASERKEGQLGSIPNY